MRISDWSSDVCSSDLQSRLRRVRTGVAFIPDCGVARRGKRADTRTEADCGRSEEHTSEIQSLMRISYAVFCLKKKKRSVFNKQFRYYIIHINNNSKGYTTRQSYSRTI